MATNPSHAALPALRCPKCAAEMVTYERSGIHLDQCRECRGIFLDRGELERIVDAESNGAGWAGPVMQAPAPVPIPQSAYPGGYPHPSPGHPPAGYPPAADPRAASRGRDWDDDDDDDDRERPGRDDWDDRGRWDERGRRPARRSILGELLESLGD